ncbi:hypothetical protein [Streptomyces nanshensis]|uniref:Uncharacterized protein n=1 Tax=Streptomyces nanshensis TaxID=518642 RepID=A0A1E7LCB0_9ACTN|nr:hypothetical protein [Streptomyces nanshensis]OEV13790.1 hypothetical protein AN218_01780 [Streptomyces nanshensis]
MDIPVFHAVSTIAGSAACTCTRQSCGGYILAGDCPDHLIEYAYMHHQADSGTCRRYTAELAAPAPQSKPHTRPLTALRHALRNLHGLSGLRPISQLRAILTMGRDMSWQRLISWPGFMIVIVRYEPRKK